MPGKGKNKCAFGKRLSVNLIESNRIKGAFLSWLK